MAPPAGASHPDLGAVRSRTGGGSDVALRDRDRIEAILVDFPGESEREITVNYSVDPRVDAYIDALPDWQQAICRAVRELVHAADSDVAETIKFTNRPYFVLQGNICALLAAKDHVNVFLYDGGIVPDPEQIITGGHDNTTARTVAIRQGETINASALSAMFTQIIANNRAGGWRRLKREN